MVQNGRGNRVANESCPQVVGVVAKQMLSRGRQRMREQPRFLPDSHVRIVCSEITLLDSGGIKMGSIETSPGPQADFLFRDELQKRPYPGPPIVIEHCFPFIIVQTRLPFQTALCPVADPN